MRPDPFQLRGLVVETLERSTSDGFPGLHKQQELAVWRLEHVRRPLHLLGAHGSVTGRVLVGQLGDELRRVRIGLPDAAHFEGGHAALARSRFATSSRTSGITYRPKSIASSSRS